MKNIIAKIKVFTDGISRKNINAHAAASAFYMFLSLVPFIAIVTAIIPLTGLSQDTLLEIIDRYIPTALQSIIENVIGDIYFAPGAILPLSILIAIWLSSRAFSALIRGIEDIADAPKYSSFLRRSLTACIYTVGIIAVMIILLTLMVFGQEIYQFLSSTLPGISPALRLLIKLRFVVVFIVIAAVFLAIYIGSPGMKLRFAALIPGAAAAAGAWLLFTWLFSLFIVYGGGYSTYGSLAAIIISLLWMYWCMYIILIGAYINVFIQAKKYDY